jgi:ribonuclease P protein component
MLCQPEGFAQALRRPALAHTEHFALHRLPAEVMLESLRSKTEAAKLSTTPGQPRLSPVDNPVNGDVVDPPVGRPQAPLLGLVIPKRHAKRAVTRNLIRRESKHAAALALQAARDASGAWVVRLRGPFAVQKHRSAASIPLRTEVRAQLQDLFAKGLRR